MTNGPTPEEIDDTTPESFFQHGLTVGALRAALEGVPDGAEVSVYENGDVCFGSVVETRKDERGVVVEVIVG